MSPFNTMYSKEICQKKFQILIASVKFSSTRVIALIPAMVKHKTCALTFYSFQITIISKIIQTNWFCCCLFEEIFLTYPWMM